MMSSDGLPEPLIAEVHGGVIEVSSKEGEGSVFTVMLPMKAD